MKPDRYTKVILTIIAIALTANLVKSFIPQANAATTNNRFATVPLNPDGSLNVKLVKGTIDVNIESVDSHAFYYAEPIEVKIKN